MLLPGGRISVYDVPAAPFDAPAGRPVPRTRVRGELLHLVRPQRPDLPHETR